MCVNCVLFPRAKIGLRHQILGILSIHKCSDPKKSALVCRQKGNSRASGAMARRPKNLSNSCGGVAGGGVTATGWAWLPAPGRQSQSGLGGSSGDIRRKRLIFLGLGGSIWSKGRWIGVRTGPWAAGVRHRHFRGKGGSRVHGPTAHENRSRPGRCVTPPLIWGPVEPQPTDPPHPHPHQKPFSSGTKLIPSARIGGARSGSTCVGPPNTGGLAPPRNGLRHEMVVVRRARPNGTTADARPSSATQGSTVDSAWPPRADGTRPDRRSPPCLSHASL